MAARPPDRLAAMTDDRENRLGRWSRRKAEAREGVEEDGEAASAAEQPAVETAKSEAEIVAALPRIEDLEPDSDYTPFMEAGVPEQLQRLALRKLWLSDPVLANVDGLVDYGEDFSIIETAADTVFQVGKGLLAETDDKAVIDGDDEGMADAADDAVAVQTTEDMDADAEDADGPPDQT